MKHDSTLQRSLLGLLAYDGGFAVDLLAQRIPRGVATPRQHSAAITQALLELERRGRVRRLDDEKPIAWVLVNPASIGRPDVPHRDPGGHGSIQETRMPA